MSWLSLLNLTLTFMDGLLTLSFFYRNQPNMALLGVIVKDQAFYDLVKEGTPLELDCDAKTVSVNGKVFSFEISDLEQ